MRESARTSRLLPRLAPWSSGATMEPPWSSGVVWRNEDACAFLVFQFLKAGLIYRREEVYCFPLVPIPEFASVTEADGLGKKNRRTPAWRCLDGRTDLFVGESVSQSSWRTGEPVPIPILWYGSWSPWVRCPGIRRERRFHPCCSQCWRRLTRRVLSITLFFEPCSLVNDTTVVLPVLIRIDVWGNGCIDWIHLQTPLHSFAINMPLLFDQRSRSPGRVASGACF